MPLSACTTASALWCTTASASLAQTRVAAVIKTRRNGVIPLRPGSGPLRGRCRMAAISSFSDSAA